MKRLLTITLVVIVALVVVMVGCGRGPDEVAPEAPPESPPEEEAPPEAFPTESATTEPEPTPEPTPGTGGSAVGNLWQITVENAREETGVTAKGSESNPKSGYTILAVDVEFQNLDQTKILVPPNWVTVITEEGETFTAVLGEYQGRDLALSYSQMFTVSPEDPLSVILFFIVKEETIDQVFELHFQGLPLIPFSVD